MPDYIPYLPHLSALLNSTSALFLIAGYGFIRAGRIQAHRTCQVTAVITSTLFLISYLTYHYRSEERRVGKGVDLVGRRIVKKKMKHSRMIVIRKSTIQYSENNR